MSDLVTTLEIERPTYSRLMDYFGEWAMRDPEMEGLIHLIARTDLAQHEQAFLGRPKSPEEKAKEKADKLKEQAEFMSELFGVEFAAEGRSGLMVAENGLAVVRLYGTLMKAESSFGGSTSTVNAKAQVRAAAKNPKVNALLAWVESPGGTVAGTQEFSDEIAKLTKVKATAAHIEDLGASAAYWPAAQTGSIAMNRGGMAGSIGVLSYVVDSSQQAAARGMKVHVIRTGAHKGVGVPGAEVTAEQLAGLQARSQRFHEQFADAVATGRKMDRAKVDAVADGRVFVGQDAVDAGLVDALQSMDDTVGQLMERANPKQKVSVPVKGVVMSDKKPATLAELKEKFPKSTADWRESQLTAGASLEEAQSAYSDFLQAQLDSREEALAKKEKELEAKEKAETGPGRKRGVEPFSAPTGSADAYFDGDAVAEFNKRVDALMAKRTDLGKFEAAAEVAKQDPQLHTAMLLATQGKNGKGARAAKRLIAETAEDLGVEVLSE